MPRRRVAPLRPVNFVCIRLKASLLRFIMLLQTPSRAIFGFDDQNVVFARTDIYPGDEETSAVLQSSITEIH